MIPRYFLAMLGKSLRIALLLVEAIFLNVVIPGHTRGIISMPGAPAASTPSTTLRLDNFACPLCAARAAAEHNGKDASHQNGKNPQYCAICAFAAALTIPPAIDFSLPPLTRIGLAPAIERHQLIPVRIALTYDGRGPPPEHLPQARFV